MGGKTVSANLGKPQRFAFRDVIDHLKKRTWLIRCEAVAGPASYIQRVSRETGLELLKEVLGTMAPTSSPQEVAYAPPSAIRGESC
jgi:hypothetical protein